MAILRERVVWKREPGKRATLTAEERANVKRAIRILAVQLGGNRTLAEVMAMTHATVREAVTGRGKPSADTAIRVARAAGCSIDDLLEGRWPAEGFCAHCGRGA